MQIQQEIYREAEVRGHLEKEMEGLRRERKQLQEENHVSNNLEEFLESCKSLLTSMKHSYKQGKDNPIPSVTSRILSALRCSASMGWSCPVLHDWPEPSKGPLWE